MRGGLGLFLPSTRIKKSLLVGFHLGIIHTLGIDLNAPHCKLISSSREFILPTFKNNALYWLFRSCSLTY